MALAAYRMAATSGGKQQRKYQQHQANNENQHETWRRGGVSNNINVALAFVPYDVAAK